MLLKANKYRKDKKADCRQNELGSRIFMGRVFGDYAECLHFYPSFSYGRIIAGERAGVGTDALPNHFCPQCGQLTGVSTQAIVAPFERTFGAAGVFVPANADVPRILVGPCGRFGRKSR